MCINIFTYIYIYIYYENNVPSRLSPQWLCGNSCTRAHDVKYIAIYIHNSVMLCNLKDAAFRVIIMHLIKI